VAFKSPSNGRRRPAPFRPIFEALEERAVLSTYHVMNNADDGTGSLRAAIVAANAHLGADKIVFDASLSGQAIALTSGELLITDDLTINGLGASNLTVSGNNSSRVCEVAATANVTLSGLTITGGRAVSGGGILNYGTLTVRASTLSDNVAFFCRRWHCQLRTVTVRGSTLSGSSATSGGGGIYNEGTLTVNGSTLSGNSGSDLGGGIYNYVGMVTVNNSTLSGNSASYSGGGIENDFGTLTVSGSTLSGNSASYQGGGIFNYVGMVTVNNSTLSGSSAGYSGGGIENDSGR